MIIPNIRFHLKDIKSSSPTLIYLQSRFDYTERLMLTTCEKILPSHWNFKDQRAIVSKKPSEYADLNFWLNKMETTARSFFRDCIINGIVPTAAEAKAHLEEKLNINFK